MSDTFGSPWRRPTDSGAGYSKRQLQDRASFDCDTGSGSSDGCLLALVALATGAVLALVGGGGGAEKVADAPITRTLY